MQKRGNMQREIVWKNIYCPECGRKVMRHDSWGTIPISSKCSKCNKVVTYNPETKQTTIKKLPPRTVANSNRIIR